MPPSGCNLLLTSDPLIISEKLAICISISRIWLAIDSEAYRNPLKIEIHLENYEGQKLFS